MGFNEANLEPGERMKNKGFWFIFIVYCGLFIADFVTTFSLGEVKQYLEANPLFKYGGFTAIVILNFIIIGLLVWLYNQRNSTPTARFFIFNFMGMVIISRIFAIKNAMYWVKNPISVSEAQVLATEAVKTQSIIAMLSLALLPYIYAGLLFFFFNIDHKIIKK